MPTTIDSLLLRMHEAWDDPAALAALGRELHDRNRLEHARQALRRAVELDGTAPEGWEYLAYAQLRAFQNAQGRETLRRGIEATGSLRLMSALSHFADDDAERDRLMARLEDSDHPDARAGLLAHELGGEDPAGALAGLRALVVQHPHEPEPLNQLMWGVLGLRQRRTVPGIDLRRDGVPLAERAIAARPDGVSGYAMKVRMLVAEKDWDAVLAETSRALARFPDEETMMQWRGEAWTEQGDLERAAHWFARAIGAKPSFVGARIDLGKLHERQGRMDLAEEVFREIPGANPEYKAGPMSLALFLGRRGLWEEAERITRTTWPGLPPWWQQGLRTFPDAQALLAREALKDVVRA